MKSLSLALIVVTVCACDTRKVEAPATASNQTAAQVHGEPTSGPLTLKDIKVSASQHTYQTEDAPKAEVIETQLLLQLNNSPGFKPEGGQPASGSATYEVKVTDARTEVMLFGTVKPKADDSRGLQAEIWVTDADVEDKSVEKVVNEAVGRFVARISAQARVAHASDADIPEMLDDPAGRLVALQEIRDRRLRNATPKIRTLLNDQDARVRVAAAAALVAFEDRESYSHVVALAEEFSRDKNPQLLPLIYILADIPTEEAKIYLQTLADAHEVKAVRDVATEALQKK